jgi:tRNA threonylcarbamoyl adenosine modification protein YeaZ
MQTRDEETLVTLLSFDAASTACSAAILADGRIVAERFEAMERGQAEVLVPMIADVLAQADKTLEDIDALAVTIGPGAFTGIRIGLAAAHGLALARKIPSIGLTTFEAVAYPAVSELGPGETLIAAVERDDPEAVCRFISPKAEQVQQFARAQMRLFSMSRGKYHNLEITVNDAASPPIAQVRFSAVFYWKNKEPIDGMSLEQPIPQSVRFETEWIKTKDRSWLLTKCQPFPLRNF